MSKVYFSCSISGGRDHAHMYEEIVEYIKATGADVLCEIFAHKNLTVEMSTGGLPDSGVWKRDTNWVKESDVVIVEATQPSLGVGYEIAKAEDWGKPILALFYDGSGRRLSPMVAGNPSVKVFRYKDIKETRKVIADFLAAG